jgi:nicotinamidase-related amidase
MGDHVIDRAHTAVLIMDYQKMLVDGCVGDPEATLSKVEGLLRESRSAGITVIYVTVGFRPGYPEVSDNNAMFSAVREGKRFQIGDEASQIPAKIKPETEDSMVVKHRVSAFEGTNLGVLLRARNVDTLVLFGITTSGVVLSTIRQAADLDFRMFVLEDLCYDFDDEVHQFLMKNILPKQATVIQAETYVQSLRV